MESDQEYLSNVYYFYLSSIRRGSSRYWRDGQCSQWSFSLREKVESESETKVFCARQYLESDCLNIIFPRSRFIPLRASPSLNEFQISHPPAWSYRLHRKSDIALNAVFTWVEVRRLDFIGDKPVDARTWPFTIVKLARIHYSLERFATIIVLQRFHIYSLRILQRNLA